MHGGLRAVSCASRRGASGTSTMELRWRVPAGCPSDKLIRALIANAVRKQKTDLPTPGIEFHLMQT
eukprot:CAMPEP_0183506424 /NCGR_PEP_ID=MMETSP0371-20130417/7436_1 /TAXON_ID=268820 /ORGANISM="Peridinium aciculiferum, Strain PAER-2" /LENGTH=65 /DNA_ID=CAMNT_0025702369 /DNA_START=63 /DNA_END=257 /DNA_ORIENTATION=-